MHSDRAVVIVFMPLFFKSFFGRIFNSEMGTYWLLVVNGIISVSIDIGVRLANWNRHKVIKWLGKKYPATWAHPKGFLKGLLSTPGEDVFYGQFLNYEKAHESIGIFMSLALTLISYIYTANSRDIPIVVYSLLIQVSFELTGQVITTLMEYYFDVPVLHSTGHYKEFMPIFMYSTLLGAMFCSVRGYAIITNQWSTFMDS